jgi:hypothetical protein
MFEDFESARTAETEAFNKIAEEREEMKEARQGEREAAFKDLDESREAYKNDIIQCMESRNKYRETIDARKAKENILLDMISQEKADVAGLKSAIEAAEEFRVKPKYITRARKFL